jgi:ferrous iron transport protein A
MERAAALSAVEPETLAQLNKGDEAIVEGLIDGDASVVGEVAGSTVSRRLLELGFVPGERVSVVATAWPGGDPMAVRVGAGVFALRRREARAVRIRRASEQP